jgi:hypothetical protein
MKNLILKIFLVLTLFCASGFAFAVTTLNINSTQDEVNAAVQAAGTGGYEALAIELATAKVPTQFILNAVAKYYGLTGVQNVANSFVLVLGMNADSVNAAALVAITSNGLDPAAYVPAAGAGGGTTTGPTVSFTPIPGGSGAISPN